jgi:ABC-type branched-subunit amino acid transport system ATPase component/branched-subunit amino acid ABC-type transport system permease component
MHSFLPFIVIGLVTGSVYGLAAVGLVLTFRTSRIFNFAHGALATVAVLLFLALVYRAGLVWQIAAAVLILVIGPLMGGGFELLGRRLSPLSTEAKVAATIGLVLVIDGAVTLWGQDVYSARAAHVHPSLPGSLVRILGVNVGVDQIIIVAAGLLATAMLYVVIERTTLGMSMRAVVDNRELLASTGRRPTTPLRAGWALGIAFVALSGLLLVISPSYSVSPTSLSALVLQAFGGAAIGGFSSLPLAYLGGIVIGTASALSTKYVTDVAWLSGLPPSIPFVVLFVVLILQPRKLATESTVRPIPPSRPRVELPPVVKVALALALVSAVAAVPLFGNPLLIYSGNEALGYAIIFLGLGLLVRTSGQVSLCQVGLAAVGATTFVRMAGSYHIPWFGAVLLGGVLAAAVGLIVAIPAIRVAGIYLALATFGFGVLLELLIYPTNLMFETGHVTTAPRPIIGPFDARDDKTFFFVALGLFLIAFVAIEAARRARLGRLLRALADSPLALAVQGCSVNITRVAVFALAAFLAGIGGAVIVSQNRFLVSDPFGSTNSLLLVVLVLIFRVAEPFAAVLAATCLVIVPNFLSPTASVWWLDIGFGVAALVMAISTGSWMPRFAWTSRRERQPPPVGPAAPAPAPTEAAASTRPASGLEVRDLTVRFSGLLAVDSLSLAAPPGAITGLIGPNGAGKTTILNFCSGLVDAASGAVLLNGEDLSSMSPPARARRGLGRTFQKVQLFESLTVWQNVTLGREGGMAGRQPLAHVAATSHQKEVTNRAAADALELVGVTALSARPVATLSTGEKRLVELARCLSGPFEMLLLDEPSSGLDDAETRQFGEILIHVVRQRGVGVLLVEHDMSLVSAVCSSVYVLDFGHLIYHGTPADTLESELVRQAYLGAAPVVTEGRD